MKKLIAIAVMLSLSAWSATSQPIRQGSGYAPNDGSARPGNPGTFTSKAGMGKAAPKTTGVGTDIDGAGIMGTSTTVEGSNADPTMTETEGLERGNTSPNPISKDTTLQGKMQTGPYKTGTQKQLQEEEIDYRTNPDVDHNDIDASEDQ